MLASTEQAALQMMTASVSGDGLPRLTSRQEECLRGVLDLKSAKQIARDLGISQHAVEKHLRAVRDKFGVDSTAQAARLYALAAAGRDVPHYGSSDLEAEIISSQAGANPDQSQAWSGDQYGALFLEAPLTPVQTMLTIAAVCFASIVGLLLLVACADGIRRVVSG